MVALPVAVCSQLVDHGLEAGQHGRTPPRRMDASAGRPLAPHRRCGNTIAPHFFQVDAGEHHVLDVGCACGNDLAAQRARAHKGAGGSLKSSAMRPSNFRPQVDIGPSIHLTASPEQKAFVVERNASAVSAGARQ